MALLLFQDDFRRCRSKRLSALPLTAKAFYANAGQRISHHFISIYRAVKTLLKFLVMLLYYGVGLGHFSPSTRGGRAAGQFLYGFRASFLLYEEMILN